MINPFDDCRRISELLNSGNEDAARNGLIQLLDSFEKADMPYTPLVNHLIRELGLYPYIEEENADWEDQFIKELFETDIGGGRVATLHREQSKLLKALLSGKDLAVSAPTSFGKSFVIDAFIAIKKPTNVVIIVPTIALTDETRRRLYKKFANEYKIITTSDVSFGEKNIFIFPQERVFGYVASLPEIDILIVDEFYKASPKFEKERSPALLRALLALTPKSRQRYFLAPNIDDIPDNIFSKGTEFYRVDFNTVVLNEQDYHNEIIETPSRKNDILLDILDKNSGKTLIYAGTFVEVNKVSDLLISKIAETPGNNLCNQFADWICNNYGDNWSLPTLLRRGIGIHNGKLHRSLGQLQVHLFEEPDGIQRIVSTSSIIEGVNTSTENVIVWRNKNGRSTLNSFSFKNLVGRSGRMFKYFVGNAFILDAPEPNQKEELILSIPDEIGMYIDTNNPSYELSSEQVAKIIYEKEDIAKALEVDDLDSFIQSCPFQTTNSGLIKSIAQKTKSSDINWNCLHYLNKPDPERWTHSLFTVIDLQRHIWDSKLTTFVNFVKVISNNWTKTIPELLDDLEDLDVEIDDFFVLERDVTFKLAALLNDLSIIQKRILKDKAVDISSFINKVSHAFLPSAVYQLEEYGLPRMISRKIHDSHVINFENDELTLHATLNEFRRIGKDSLLQQVAGLDDFDRYIIDYFYDGISLPEATQTV